MKKIILALAMIGMAVASQAAATKWEFWTENMPGPVSGKYSGDVLITCAAAGFSQAFTVSGGELDEFFTADDGVFTPNTVYTFTMTASANVDGKDYVFSATGAGKALEVGTKDVGFEGGSWTAVPEPTSGLLLLLGVAGLALKRKRA